MSTPTRTEVEDFLFHEAELLDSWRLPEWFQLFEPGASYFVPSPDLPPTAMPDQALFLIADDHLRIEQRVLRLMKKTAHSEWPRPKTLHMVSNVRVRGVEGDAVRVQTAFATHRTKESITHTFIGESHYLLTRATDGLRIREKRCLLAVDNLRGPGKLGILL